MIKIKITAGKALLRQMEHVSFQAITALCLLFYTAQVSAQNQSELPSSKDSTIVVKDTVTFSLGKSNKGGLDKKVEATAKDSILYMMKKKRVYLYNDATIAYDGITLKAHFIEVDFETKTLWARGIVNDSSGKYEGKPVFVDDGKEYTADSMQYNFESKRGISSGAVTTEQEGFVYGEKVMRDSAENIYVKGARYTTCNAEDPHFHIQTGKLKITKNKQVVTGPANLVIEKIRTPLAIPFGFFPAGDKQSKGIIFGNYGETEDRGFFLKGFGWYTPINDHFDLALTGDFYFRGSYGFQVRSNYKKRYRYNGNLSFNYNFNEFNEQGTEAYATSQDIQLLWAYNQDGKAKPGRSFSANVNFVTSSYLKNNTFNVNDIIKNNVVSSVSYSRRMANNKLSFSMTSRMDQNLAKQEVALTLPDIALTLSRQTPFAKSRTKLKVIKNLGFNYSSNFKNRATVHENSLVSLSSINDKGPLFQRVFPVIDSFSNGIRHNLPISTAFKAFTWFTVNPSVSFTDYWYFKTIRKEWDGSDSSIVEREVDGFERAGSYSSSISIGTIIYGRKYFKKGSKLNAISHVMRPTLSASFSPDLKANNSHDYRQVQSNAEGSISDYSIFEGSIIGAPSGSPSASLNFGLGNNLEIKVRSDKDTANDGIKKVKLIEALTVSTGYDFLRDSLKLNNISINANTRLFNKVSLTGNLTLDPYDFSTDENSSRRINQYYLNSKGKLGRVTSARISVSTSLNPEANKRKQATDNVSQAELDIINAYPNHFVDFSIPWNVNLSYNLTYSKRFADESQVNQTLTFNGDVNLTPNWKIGFNSGYNFALKETTVTKFTFFRDLHCWEFNLGWIPIGVRRSFDFTIRVKSSTLQDLKLSRRNFWYDN